MAPAHPHATGVAVYTALLVADIPLYKRLCLSVGSSVGPLLREHELKSRKMSVLDADAFWAAAPNGRCHVGQRSEFPDVLWSVHTYVLPPGWSTLAPPRP